MPGRKLPLSAGFPAAGWGFLQAGVRVVEPVVYSVDNTYYLDYNFNNERDGAGAAFFPV